MYLIDGLEGSSELRLGVVYMGLKLPKHIASHEHSIAMPPQLLPGGVELQKLDEVGRDC
jgi:hypothetical protein